MKTEYTEQACQFSGHEPDAKMVENKVVIKKFTEPQTESPYGIKKAPVSADIEVVQHTCLGCGERWFSRISEE